MPPRAVNRVNARREHTRQCPPSHLDPCRARRLGAKKTARVSRRGAVKAPRAAVRSVAARAGGVGTPFTTWILQQEMEENIDGELAVVLSSIGLACKQIASLVQRGSRGHDGFGWRTKRAG